MAELVIKYNYNIGSTVYFKIEKDHCNAYGVGTVRCIVPKFNEQGKVVSIEYEITSFNEIFTIKEPDVFNHFFRNELASVFEREKKE